MDALAKICVSGMVQGVGFRYFVSSLANSFNLVGIVKNLYDGQVYIEVEGNKDIIVAFLQELRIGNRFSDVQEVKVEWEAFTGKYNHFDITH